MNAMLKSIVRTSILGAGLVGTSVALAHQPAWSNSRWNREPVRVAYQPVVEYDYARVVDVDPIVRRVAVATPQRECWYEDQQVYARPSSATPTVLGAIIGGVIGHQFGNGYSRNVGTAAGVALGASVGHDISMRNVGVETRSVERCEVSARHEWEERVDGYHVTYRYQGRTYDTVMPYDPGNRVQVRVGVDVDVVR